MAGAVRAARRVAVLGLAFAVLTSASHAEIYKWVDAHGQVHYGDKDAGPGAKSMHVQSHGESSPPPDEDQRRERREKLLNSFSEDRAEKKAKAAEEKKREDDRKKNCELARKQQLDYQNASYLYDYDAQGKRVNLGDAELTKAREEAAALVKKWCTKGSS